MTPQKPDVLSSEKRLKRTFDALKETPTFANTITLLVGPEKQAFTVHESILKQKSDYFRTALSRPWKEAEKKTFELSDENAVVFAAYVHWLYFDKLPVLGLSTDSDILLVELYLIGERRLSLDLRNHIMNELKKKWVEGSNFPSAEVIELVFAESMEKSKLRQLIIDKFAWETEPDALSKMGVRDNLPADFAFGIFEALLARVETSKNAEPPVIPNCGFTARSHMLHHDEDSGSHWRCGSCGAGFGKSAYPAIAATVTRTLRDVSKAPYKTAFALNYHETDQSGQ
jgi:hypothetical protein